MLGCALHIHILTVTAGKVAGDGLQVRGRGGGGGVTEKSASSSTHLPEASRAVGARAMDEERVEEHSVPSLHLQVQPWHRRVIVLDAMVHLVDTTLRASPHVNLVTSHKGATCT